MNRVGLILVAAMIAAVANGANRDFSDLDPNYKNKAVQADGMDWYDAFSAPLVVEGAPFVNADGSRTRFPMAATEKLMAAKNYQVMGKQMAGVVVRFKTNSGRISVKAVFDEFYVNQKCPVVGCGFDFYRAGKWAGLAVPPLTLKDGDEFTMTFGGTGRKEGELFTLYLPAMCGLRSLKIGIQSGREFFAVPDHALGKGPIVFYGSSITHCGSASRPGLEHGAMVCRNLDAEFLNVGYCGSCHGDLAAAEVIASVKPLALVMEYDDNAFKADELKVNHPAFFRRFRELCPKTPVLILTSPCPLFGLESRKTIVRTWLEAVDAGDRNVDFIDTSALFDDCVDVNECFMDGGHQNDLGGKRMATAIEGRLRRNLKLKIENLKLRIEN